MGAFDDLIPTAEKPASSGAFDDLIPKSGGAFDDLIPARKMDENKAVLKQAPEEGLLSKVGRTLRESITPLIGPSESQLIREGIVNEETGQPEYKPLGGAVESEGLLPALSKPMVPLPRFKEEKGDEKGVMFLGSIPVPKPLGKAVLNTATGFLEFAESPLGIATAGLGRFIPRTTSGAYAADIASKTPEAARVAGEASVSGTTQEKAESLLQLGVNVFLPGLLGGKALAPKRETLITKPHLDQRAIVSPESLATQPPTASPFEVKPLFTLVERAGEKAELSKAVEETKLTPPEGDRIVTVQRPDGTTYEAAFSDKYWEIPGMDPIPSIAKWVDGAWSHGMLSKGEKIIEGAKKAEMSSGQEMGLMMKNPVLDAMTETVGSKSWWQKYFTAEGALPKDVHRAWIESRGKITAETKDIDYNTRDLYKALRENHDIGLGDYLTKGMREVPQEVVQQINNVLGGKAEISTLPENVRKPVEKMREHVDKLSQHMIDRGLIGEELQAKIGDNMGTYLTRSYRIFDDPKWVKNIPPDIRARAENYVYEGLLGIGREKAIDPTATIETARTKLGEMLADWSESGVDAQMRGGKLGSKDLSLFMKRKDLAPEIRAVLGEYKDPVVNYARSITKMARFIGDQEFLNSVRQRGMGEFLFKSGESKPGFESELAAPGSSTMAPLNGLRTSPQIKEAFETFNRGTVRPEWWARTYFGLNALSKSAKTVFSFLTQMRNLLGQPFFNLMSGHWDFSQYKKGVKALAADIGVNRDVEWRDYYKKMTRLGIVNESAPANELRAALKDAGLKDSTYEDMAAQGMARVIKKVGVEAPIRAYQISDELGKIVGFENERARMEKVHPDWTADQLDKSAAERVRNTYPTYSMVPEWVKSWRKQPLFGPFVSFAYESFRTAYHNMRYAVEDMRSENPAQRRAGMERAAGIMTVIGSGYVLSNLSAQMHGIDKQSEDDIRRFLPFWSKNGQLIFTGKDENGKISYINYSYQNPYSYMTDPLVAMLNNNEKDLDDKMIQAFAELIRPFSNEQMLSSAIIDAMRNTTSTGKQVYNPQDDFDTKFAKVTGHMAKALEPGTSTRLRERIIPSITDEQPDYGRKLEPATEIASEISGIRAENFDFKQGLTFKTRDFKKKESDAEYIFNGAVYKTGSVPTEKLIENYKEADDKRFKLWRELYGDIRAARRNGVKENEIASILLAQKLPKRDMGPLLSGKYTPQLLSQQTIQRAAQMGRVIPFEAIADYQRSVAGKSLE